MIEIGPNLAAVLKGLWIVISVLGMFWVIARRK
jgi:hypothetical protein